jgi:hypothetical protein
LDEGENEDFDKLLGSLEKEMEAEKLYVKEAVAEALNVNISDIADEERFGGLTSKNYRMTIAGRELVARDIVLGQVK